MKKKVKEKRVIRFSDPRPLIDSFPELTQLTATFVSAENMMRQIERLHPDFPKQAKNWKYSLYLWGAQALATIYAQSGLQSVVTETYTLGIYRDTLSICMGDYVKKITLGHLYLCLARICQIDIRKRTEVRKLFIWRDKYHIYAKVPKKLI